MSLFTVDMVRKQIVSRYGARGERLGEIETNISLTFHDLPYSTAQAYQIQFPDAQVKITKQDGEIMKPRPVYSFRKSEVDPTQRQRAGMMAARSAAAAPKTDKTLAAAISGSLGAALEIK